MSRRREGQLRRALLLAGAMVIAVGIVGAGIPSGAIATTTSTEPAPSDPAPTETPTADPAPTTSAEPSTPATPTLPAPTPSVPSASPPVSTPDDSAIAPAPAPSADNTPVVSRKPLATPTTVAAPAGFGLVFPTNPWIYNAEPGTRYLDERERIGVRVTRYHLGIDAQGGVRQPIFAVADGTVVDGTWGTTSRDRHGFGNQVEIAHSDGFATRYAHLAEAPLVQPGDHVTAGQLIGYMGGSQRGDLDALARHLHFEVTKDGSNIDPIAFLGGAHSATDAGPVGAAAPAGSLMLYEIRAKATDQYASASTGLAVNSNVFTAVAMGGDSAQVMVSEGGTLKQLAVVDGSWSIVDTHLPLSATSISGVASATGLPELLAVEDGKLFHIVGNAAGWTKTWTGHYFSGTVSAVRMPGGELHAMLQQAGYLYHLYPAQGGLWNVTDTRLRVGDQVDAGYVGGPALEAMTVIDGEIYRVTRGELAWNAVSTGLPAQGALAAVYPGGGFPLAISAEPDAIGVTRVVDQVWMRYRYDVTVPGPIDAVTIGGNTMVLYSIG